MGAPGAAVEPMRRMRLGQQVHGVSPPPSGQQVSQRDHIPNQHPTHQTVTSRKGPGPNCRDSCATDTVTGKGPSAVRIASG